MTAQKKNLQKKNFLRRHIGKLSLGALFLAAALPVSQRVDLKNRMFEDCIESRIAGAAHTTGIIHDQLGTAVMFNAAARSTPIHDALGMKKGVYIFDDINGHHYHYGLNGQWDVPRVLGVPLPMGTWGRGDIVPTPKQEYFAKIADDCAGSDYVSSTTRFIR